MTVILNFLVAIFAILLILVGLVAAISPIPFGLLFILLGLILLGVVIPPMRPVLRGMRRRWGWLDDRLDELQEELPEGIADPLRESDPCEEDQDKR